MSKIRSLDGWDVTNDMKTQTFFVDKKYIGTIFFWRSGDGYSVRLISCQKEFFHHTSSYDQAKKLIMSHNEIIGNIHNLELKG